MLKRLQVLLCALVATVFAVAAPAAVAQSDGVTVDPGSPSGKEYALPVDRARQQAAKKKKAGTSTTPLFGEGVNDNGPGGTSPTTTTPKSSSGPSSKSAKDAKQRKSRADAAARAAAKAKADAAATVAAATRRQDLERSRALQAQATTPDGGIGMGGIIGVGVAVLLVGGLIGLWLRRRASTT